MRMPAGIRGAETSQSERVESRRSGNRRIKISQGHGVTPSPKCVAFPGQEPRFCGNVFSRIVEIPVTPRQRLCRPLRNPPEDKLSAVVTATGIEAMKAQATFRNRFFVKCEGREAPKMMPRSYQCETRAERVRPQSSGAVSAGSERLGTGSAAGDMQMGRKERSGRTG